MINPYSILNVPPDASLGEIKKAYFRLVKKHPPETDPEKFKTIRLAYEQLRTQASRARTDFFNLKEPAGSFILSSDVDDTDSYMMDVSFDDFMTVIEALYSDLTKTDFKKDFTEFGT